MSQIIKICCLVGDVILLCTFFRMGEPLGFGLAIIATIVAAMFIGHEIGAKSFPYLVNKKWVAAKDHRTRHSHRDVANHVNRNDRQP